MTDHESQTIIAKVRIPEHDLGTFVTRMSAELQKKNPYAAAASFAAYGNMVVGGAGYGRGFLDVMDYAGAAIIMTYHDDTLTMALSDPRVEPALSKNTPPVLREKRADRLQRNADMVGAMRLYTILTTLRGLDYDPHAAEVNAALVAAQGQKQ